MSRLVKEVTDAGSYDVCALLAAFDCGAGPSTVTSYFRVSSRSLITFLIKFGFFGKKIIIIGYSRFIVLIGNTRGHPSCGCWSDIGFFIGRGAVPGFRAILPAPSILGIFLPELYSLAGVDT